MQYVDEGIVKALELRAPGVCTRDADEVRGQILGGAIFSAFGEEDRAGIWARILAVDDLIPSLNTLFENWNYLKVLTDCMISSLPPPPYFRFSFLSVSFMGKSQMLGFRI